MRILALSLILAACVIDPQDDKPPQDEITVKPARCPEGGVWVETAKRCEYPDIRPSAP